MSFGMLSPEYIQVHRRRGSSRQEGACSLDGQQQLGRRIRLSIPSEQNLGALSTLPTELLSETLVNLDLPSLATFRRVNRRAMLAVESLPAYRMLRQHCPDLLGAAVALDASFFDLRHLHETLQLSQCSNCDGFGSHLYLITCRRVCYDCFSTCSDYGHPMSRAFAPCSRGDAATEAPRRFVALISAPVVSSVGNVVDWGVACPDCSDVDKSRYLGDGLARHQEWHRTQQMARREAVATYSNLLHEWFLSPGNQARADNVLHAWSRQVS